MSETLFYKVKYQGNWWLKIKGGLNRYVSLSDGRECVFSTSSNLVPIHLEIIEKEPPLRAGDRFVDKAGVRTTLVNLDSDKFALGQKGLLHENFSVHPIMSNLEDFIVSNDLTRVRDLERELTPEGV